MKNIQRFTSFLLLMLPFSVGSANAQHWGMKGWGGDKEPAGVHKVTFDKQACKKFDFGTIDCNETYSAEYVVDKKVWRVTGVRKDKVKLTADYPGDESTFSLWGLRLEKKGEQLFFNKTLVGQIN